MIPDFLGMYFDAALVLSRIVPFFHICPGHAVIHQVWNMGQLWNLILITVTNWFTPVKTPIYYCEKLTFLKLVERVSWSKKTQCGQHGSPPDLQLSAQVLSWIDFQLEVNCQYFVTPKQGKNQTSM